MCELARHGTAGAGHGMCELARHGTAGAAHGMCELAPHGTAGAGHGMCELALHGTAGARHGMCELAFKAAFDIPLGKQTSAHFLPYTQLAAPRSVVAMFTAGQTDTAQYCPQYTVQPFTITPILTVLGLLSAVQERISIAPATSCEVGKCNFIYFHKERTKVRPSVRRIS